MAEKVLKLRIQQKYDTVAKWRNSELVLFLGEIALDETNGIKIGDGVRTWNNLPYVTDELASQLSSAVISLDNKISSVDENMQSAVITLNEKIDSLDLNMITVENKIDDINTNIEIIENNEIPISKLVNPVDNTEVLINCGDSSD